MAIHRNILIALASAFVLSGCGQKAGRQGIITTVAGDGWHDKFGSGRFAGDGGPATKASLNGPSAVAVGPDGSLYICDRWNQRIRKVDPRGIITTIAGDGWRKRRGDPTLDPGRFRGDGGPATEASLSMPLGVAVGADGSLYIADAYNNRIRRVDSKGIIITVAGDGWRDREGMGRLAGDGGPATKASLSYPEAVAVGTDSSLYIVDGLNERIRRVDPKGIITTMTVIEWANSIAMRKDGSIFVAGADHRIRKVDRNGAITIVAGDGWEIMNSDFPGRFRGNGGPATEASLSTPLGVAVGADGSLYIADAYNNRIRRVDRKGIITTVAGDGWPNRPGIGRFTGNGGPATEASLNTPNAVAIGPDGSLYIADAGNHRIRKVMWKGNR